MHGSIVPLDLRFSLRGCVNVYHFAEYTQLTKDPYIIIPLGLTVDLLVVHHLALKPRSCFDVSDLNSMIILLPDDLMTR